MISSEKALSAVFANKAFSVERRGVEPPTSALRTHESSVPSVNLSEVTATGSDGCTNGCTSETGKARRSRSKAGIEPAPAAADASTGGDFAAALAMIASLPLSDAEKAEAVRRLLGPTRRGD